MIVDLYGLFAINFSEFNNCNKIIFKIISSLRFA